MSTRKPLFRVFVSSTFRDLKPERDALLAHTFRRLEAFCRARGAQFQAVDLRWGISQQAIDDQALASICLEEVERCTQDSPPPSFIVLLGDRYGSRLLPESIDSAEFERLAERLSPEAAERARALYSRDDNALPARHVLLPRAQAPGTSDTPGSDWARAAEQLRRELLAAFDASHTPDDPRRLAYAASLTHREIEQGPLLEPARGAHTLCYERLRVGADDEAVAERYADRDADGAAHDRERVAALGALKGALRGHVPEEHYHVYEVPWERDEPPPELLKQLAERVAEDLERLISAQLADGPAQDPAQREREVHARFARQAGQRFLGRDALLSRLATRCRARDGQPLVVTGRSASGKTTLLARLCTQAAEDTGTRVVQRFVGASPRSVEPLFLLESLCDELARLVSPLDPVSRPEGAPAARTGGEQLTLLSERFRALLQQPHQHAGLLVVLDGLDQLESAHRALSWLGRETFEGTTLVVCVSEDSPWCAEVRAALPDARLERVPELGPGDIDAIVTGWLAQRGRRLTPAQGELLRARAAACPSPLYLRLALLQAVRWRSFDTPQEDWLGADLRGAVRSFLEHLEEGAQHGPVLVRRVVENLLVARRGLSESELLELLSSDADVQAEQRARAPDAPLVERLPMVVWSRLYSDLAPYLSETASGGAVLLNFLHRGLLDRLVELRLDATSERRACERLERFFDGGVPGVVQPNYLSDPDGTRVPNGRRLSELPHQRAALARLAPGALARESLAALLTDLEFVAAKVEAGLLEELLEEARAALGAWPGIVLDDPFDTSAFDVTVPETSPKVLEELRALGPGEVQRDEEDPRYGFLEDVPEEELPPPGAAAAGFARLRETERTSLTPAPPPDATAPERLAVLLRFLAADGHLLRSSPGSFLAIARNSAAAGWLPDAAQAVLDQQARPFLELRARGPGAPEHPLQLSSLMGTREDLSTLVLSADGLLAAGGGGHPVASPSFGDEFMDPATGRTMRVAHAPGDYSLRLWDARSGETIHVLRGHEDQVNALSFSRDGTRLASVAGDCTLRIWDARQGRLLRTLGLDVEASACALTGDGRRVVTVQRKRGAWLLDLDGGEPLALDARAGGHLGWTPLSITPDGRLCATSDEEQIRVCDTSRPGTQLVLRGHRGAVSSLAFSAGGELLASCDMEGDLRVWETAGGRLLRSEHLSAQSCTALALSEDGHLLVVATWGHRFHVLDVRTGEIVRRLKVEQMPMSMELTLSASGRVFAAMMLTRGEVMDLVAGTPVVSAPTKEFFDGSFNRHAADPESGWFAVGDGDDVHFYTSRSKRFHRQPLVTSEVRVLGADPSGRYLGASDGDGAVRVFDLLRYATRRELRGHLGITYGVAFSPDGQLLFTSSADPILRGWELATGDCIDALESHGGPVHALAMAPDGRWIVSGGGNSFDDADYDLRIWSLRTGSMRRLVGHTASVTGLMVSPDGLHLWSTGADGTLKLWAVATGEVLAEYQADEPLNGVRRGATAGEVEVVSWSKSLRVVSPRHVQHGAPLATPTRKWRLGPFEPERGERPARVQDEAYGIRCAHCERWSRVGGDSLETLGSLRRALAPGTSPILYLPEGAWSDPRLDTACSECGGHIRLTPFLYTDALCE